MSTPRMGELFAGYGGLGMGVQAALGGEMAWYSEIDKGALKILTHRFPNVPNIGDITAVDWSTVEPVDILTGGSPCQDLSHAGKRAGMTDGTRSNLWVAMREAIAQLRPPLVIWENVRGAYSAEADSDLGSDPRLLGSVRRRDGEPVLRALGRVLGDLSDLGYVGGWHGLRAADIGAPHGRFRVFVVATNAGGAGFGQHRRAAPSQEARAHEGHQPHRDGAIFPTPRATDGTKGGPNQRGSSGDLMLPSAVALLPTPDANADSYRIGGASQQSKSLAGVARRDELARWGEYAAAVGRWTGLMNRPAPEPTEPNTKGDPTLAPRFVEWLMGLPAGWVTNVPGITRNEALRALGNGVVPRQAEAAIRWLLSRMEAAA